MGRADLLRLAAIERGGSGSLSKSWSSPKVAPRGWLAGSIMDGDRVNGVAPRGWLAGSIMDGDRVNEVAPRGWLAWDTTDGGCVNGAVCQFGTRPNGECGVLEWFL